LDCFWGPPSLLGSQRSTDSSRQCCWLVPQSM
jgi:hypothetical protein